MDGGSTLIQLREKHAPVREFYRDATHALRIARDGGVRLIINDRVDIALALRADGVHLGQSDLPVEPARKLLGDAAIIGFSTHNIEQVKDALQLPIDYIAFGPIYSTSTKENPDPVAGLLALPEVSSLTAPLPLVAIGGITAAETREVFNAGANAIAVVSAVLAKPGEIAQNLRNMMTLAEALG